MTRVRRGPSAWRRDGVSRPSRRHLSAVIRERPLTIFFVATRRPGGTRARDSDRAAICQVLDGALADGQLSMDEHRQRVSDATSAATLGELDSLVVDLQTASAVQPFATAKSSRGPLV